jgi:hypothetical protein
VKGTLTGATALAVTAVIAAGGCKAVRKAVDEIGEGREPAEGSADGVEPPIPDVRPGGPGMRDGRYTLAEVVVEARPTNGKGQRWDDKTGPNPDLALTIRIDGKRVAACESTEALVARCRPGVEVTIVAGSTVEIEVVDDDPFDDDVVGTVTLRDDTSRWGADVALPLQPAGRVASATIRFDHIPSWWELHRGHLTGGLAGVGVALLVLFGFRRSLLVPDPMPPPPPPPPRCAHCAGLVAATDVTCGHCGAKL